ncbi:MAG TPA: hypothetical protein VEF72_27505 [Mycobacterium sp.]|nr:hypothetical protein [Mycobacterium sp.]
MTLQRNSFIHNRSDRCRRCCDRNHGVGVVEEFPGKKRKCPGLAELSGLDQSIYVHRSTEAATGIRHLPITPFTSCIRNTFWILLPDSLFHTPITPVALLYDRNTTVVGTAPRFPLAARQRHQSQHQAAAPPGGDRRDRHCDLGPVEASVSLRVGGSANW